MRSLLVIIIVVASLTVVLSFLAPSLIDAEDYRDDIEAAAAAAIGQPVQINGAMSFSVLPTPRLAAENLIISPPAGRSQLPPLLKSERVELRFSLNQLLRGRRHVDRVVIVQPSIVLLTDLAGHSNYDALKQGEQTVTQIEIQGGNLAFENQQTGRSAAVGEIVGNVERNTRNGITTGQLSGRVADNETSLTFRLGTGQRPALTVDVAAPGLGKVGFKGRVSPGQKLQVEGNITLSIEHLGHVLPAAVADTIDGGEGTNLPFRLKGLATLTPGSVSIPELSGRIGKAGFDGRLSVQNGEVIDVDTALSFEQLDGHSILPWLQQATAAMVDGQAAIDRPDGVRVKAGLNVGLIAHNDQFVRQLRLDTAYQKGVVSIARATALMPGGSDLAFSGDVRLTGGAFKLTGSTEIASDNLASLMDWAGLPLPAGGQGRLRNLSASASLLVNSDVAQITDIDLRVDQSRVTGAAAVALLKRPSFSLNLNIDKLNTNAYQAMFGVDGFQWRGLFGDPDAPHLNFLDTFDTNTTLRVGRMILNTSVLRDLRMEVGLLRGVMDIQRFRIADIDGAGLSLNGRMDTPSDPQILLRGTLTTKDPADLFSGTSILFTPMTRLSDMTVDFGVEGSLRRSAVEIDVATRELSGHMAGLISDFLGQPQLDLDIGLSGDDARNVINTILPGWRIPFNVTGPLLIEAIVKGDGEALNLNGKLDAMAARLEYKGRVEAAPQHNGREHYDLNLRLRHGDTLSLLRDLWPDYLPRAVDQRALDASLDLTGDHETMAFGAGNISVGDDRARFEGQLDLTGIRPNLALQLSDAALNLDGFLPASDHGAAIAAQVDDRSRRWSRLPIDLSWMQAFDLSLGGRFATLDAFGLSLTDGTIDAELADGEARLAALSGTIGEGALKLEGALLALEEPELRLKGSLKGVQTIAFLGPLTGAQGMENGQLDLSFRVQGAGVTPFDLVRNTRGEINVTKAGVDAVSGAGKAAIRRGVIRISPPAEISRQGQPGTLLGTIDVAGWQAEMELRAGQGTTWPSQRLTGPVYKLRSLPN